MQLIVQKGEIGRFFSIFILNYLLIQGNNMNFHTRSLTPVKNPSNSILIEQKFSNVDKAFRELIVIAKRLPRTKEIINNNCLSNIN